MRWLVMAVAVLASAGTAVAQVRYVDKDGVAHWVQSAEQVPPEYRRQQQPPLPSIIIDGSERHSSNTSTRRKECDKWALLTFDKVSGVTSGRGIEDLILSDDGGKTALRISMSSRDRAPVTIAIEAMGAGRCMRKGASVELLFTDGSRMHLASDSANCKRTATVALSADADRPSRAAFTALMTKEIETMRVWTIEGYVQSDFTAEGRRQFLGLFRCLASMGEKR